MVGKRDAGKDPGRCSKSSGRFVRLAGGKVPASSLLRKLVDERLNREAPLIDDLPLSHFGRLAHSRPIPAVAARKCALHVLPGSIHRQVCPAEGIYVICDHNDCAIPLLLR